MSSMKYINTPGRLVFEAPYALNGTDLYAFAIQGEESKIQATLDLFLNDLLEDTEIRYDALGDYCMLSLTYIAQATSASLKAPEVGNLTEAEWAFWIPVVKKVNGESDQILWFLPYLFVNGPYPMAMGREVYGFPKTIGDVQPDTNPEVLDNLSLKAWSFKEYGKNCQGQVNPILEVKKVQESFAEKLKDLVTDMIEFGKEMFNFADDISLELIVNLIKNLKNREIPMVFLKQFASATKVGEACYQEIIEAKTTLTHLESIKPIFGDYEVNLHKLDSHPFAETLGVKNGIQDLEFGMHIQMDFILEMGTSIYKSS